MCFIKTQNILAIYAATHPLQRIIKIVARGWNPSLLALLVSVQLPSGVRIMRLQLHHHHENDTENLCVAGVFLFLIVVGAALFYYGMTQIAPLHAVAQLGSAPL